MGQLRDEGDGGWGASSGRGICYPEAEALTHFRGCYISQTYTFVAEMVLSAGDRLCLCASVRACGKVMVSY